MLETKQILKKIVQQEGTSVFINSNGKMIVKAEIDEIIKLDFECITKNISWCLDIFKWSKSINNWYIAKLGDKYALFDENHKCVIEIKCDSIFNNMYYSLEKKDNTTKVNVMLLIKNKDKYGLILIELDSNYNVYFMKSCRYIVEPVADSINLFNENEGTFMVKINKKFGFIKHNGETTLPIAYDYIEELNLAKFSNAKESKIFKVEGNGKCGFVKSNGDVILNPKYDKIYKFEKFSCLGKDCLAKLCIDRKYGYITADMDIIVLDTIYDEIRHIKYKNIFARVKIKNQYKFVDTDKNHIIDIQNIKDPTEDEQFEAIEYDINFIKYIKNPTEKVQLKVLKQVPAYIEYIENPTGSAQLEAIKQKVGLITCIKNPTENVQMKVIEHKPSFIRYLKKPTENVQLTAILKEPNVIRYIKSPTEKVQLWAVKHQPSAIEYIKNPTEEVQLIAVNFAGSYVDYIENPYKSVLEHSNVKKYYGNQTIKLKLDGRYEIPEYEPGESSLLDKLYQRDYWPQ